MTREGSGALLFARYAYPPNELGYCGPEDASVLLDHGSQVAEQKIADHARRFEGAWPYLELIAAANAIPDPLDVRVVEAYWLGNELLDAVDPLTLATELQRRFVGQSGGTWGAGAPHHSFHVFAVYPWLRLLARGPRHDIALSVLEQCRIRWGEVIAVDDDGRVRVRSRPLCFEAGSLRLGAERDETAAWSVAGRSLLTPTTTAHGMNSPPLRSGDQVAMHWDWVCDVLRPEQVVELEQRTSEQFERSNASLSAAIR